MFIRLSKQQRIILSAILHERRPYYVQAAIEEALLKARGLSRPSASFRSSLSRCMKNLHAKGLIGLTRSNSPDRAVVIIIGGTERPNRAPVWVDARLTYLGRCVIERVERLKPKHDGTLSYR